MCQSELVFAFRTGYKLPLKREKYLEKIFKGVEYGEKVNNFEQTSSLNINVIIYMIQCINLGQRVNFAVNCIFFNIL